MSKEEAKIFLINMLTRCFSEGFSERISDFFTTDVKGHSQGQLFYFQDIQKRSEIFKQTIENFNVDVIDLNLFDDFIMLLTRQRGYVKSYSFPIEMIVSAVYRLRNNKICELWLITDTQLGDYASVNDFFAESLHSIEIHKKDKISFMRHFEAYPYLVNGEPIQLNQQEKECLYYYLSGLSAKEIAKKVNLSFRTVESYLQLVKQKYDCSTKAQIREKIFHRK